MLRGLLDVGTMLLAASDTALLRLLLKLDFTTVPFTSDCQWQSLPVSDSCLTRTRLGVQVLLPHSTSRGRSLNVTFDGETSILTHLWFNMASQAQPRRQVVSLEHWSSNISTAERYTSQTKSDFGAPAVFPARKDASQQKQGAATIVLGYEPTTSYATESKDQFTNKLSSPGSPGASPKAGGSSPFGAKDCIHNSLHRTAEDASPFDTEHNRFGWAAGGHAAHRAGLAAIELCRSTSLQLNQTRIVLGDTPPEYQTTTESALTGAMAALAASGETLTVPRRRPVAEAPPLLSPQTAAAAPALVPGRLVEIGSGGPPEASAYETTYGAAWAVPVDVSDMPQPLLPLLALAAAATTCALHALVRCLVSPSCRARAGPPATLGAAASCWATSIPSMSRRPCGRVARQSSSSASILFPRSRRGTSRATPRLPRPGLQLLPHAASLRWGAMPHTGKVPCQWWRVGSLRLDYSRSARLH